MSKTTTIKIMTRIVTTHLPCLDTTITIKSYPLFFGEMTPGGIRYGSPLRSVGVAPSSNIGEGRRCSSVCPNSAVAAERVGSGSLFICGSPYLVNGTCFWENRW